MFYRLLARPEEVATRVIGERKWKELVRRWEEDDRSLEADRLLEDQKRVALPLMKAQKATIALKWVMITSEDRKTVLQDGQLPYREDLKEQVDALQHFIKKHDAQYENNLIQLQATQEQQNTGEGSDFTIEDAIASLDLAGFTVSDPSKLTIGQFKAMNRAIQKNGKRSN